MPTAYGVEFRQDVIDVVRKGEAPMAQIAILTLGDSNPPLQRGDRKPEILLLEQENEILRRAAAYLARDINQNDLPAGHGSRRTKGFPWR